MLGDYTDDPTRYRFIDGYYSMTDSGPLIVLTTRSEHGVKEPIFIEGYEPYCYVRRSSLDRETVTQLQSDTRVKRLEDAEREGVETLGVARDGADDLVKIVTHAPWHVRKVRDALREMDIELYEADVRFVQRFLIDRGINVYFTVDGDTDGYVDPTQVSGVDDEAVSLIPPRVCTFDIEVLMGDGESVVSKGGTEQAQQPITSIAAHDSYHDEYRLWGLIRRSHGSIESIGTTVHERFGDEYDATVAVSLYYDEDTLLESFIDYLKQFDIVSGWNGNGFDVPYVWNRCANNEVWSIYDICPTDDMSMPSGDGQWINSDVCGIHCLDMKDAFIKTEYSTLKSKKLDYVAQKVLDVGKLEYEGSLDELYVRDPETYFTYNLVDTKRTVDINRERNIV